MERREQSTTSLRERRLSRLGRFPIGSWAKKKEKKKSLNVQTLPVYVFVRTHADGTTAADGTTTTVPAASYLKLNLKKLNCFNNKLLTNLF